MDRQTEIALLEELGGLKSAGKAFLDPDIAVSDVSRYADAAVFAEEHRGVLRGVPVIAAHASELDRPGSYMTRSLSGLPVLLTRDSEGTVHAFLNVCRHRGARLVNEPSGCKNVFSCPYHAWTWSNSGDLRGIPHQNQGFPNIDRSKHGLKRLPVLERAGWIWVLANPAAKVDFDRFLDPIVSELDWLRMETLGVTQSDQLTIKANWKLLVEGGIEAYHFRVTHKETIGPHFEDNLSSYAMFGRHMRSVLPRAGVEQLGGTDQKYWSIRKQANVLYTIFPTNQWLVMQDHVAWVSLDPISETETALRLSTLAPRDQIRDDMAEHWARNHAITRVTLTEDFEIGEAVQSGLLSGANEVLTFGRFEGALDQFNRQVADILGHSKPG